jgi:hypothetical protein
MHSDFTRIGTMPNEPSPESIARAARLREQIDKLTNPDQAKPAEREKQPTSPHEFIERKMSELDKKRK